MRYKSFWHLTRELGVRGHFVYGLHDADGRLLYVGVTKSPLGRLKQHFDDKPWIHEVAHSKSGGRKPVWVRVPPPVLKISNKPQ